MAELLGDIIDQAMREVARGYARRNGLVRPDGKIACWKCRTADALLPSLHCPRCLQVHRDANGLVAHTVNVPQTAPTGEATP